MGNEVKGVSETAMELVDYCIEIPQWGTKVTTHKISKSNATVKLSGELTNDTGSDHTIEIVSTVVDHQNKIVATSVSKGSAKELSSFNQDFIIKNPNLFFFCKVYNFIHSLCIYMYKLKNVKRLPTATGTLCVPRVSISEQAFVTPSFYNCAFYYISVIRENGGYQVTPG